MANKVTGLTDTTGALSIVSKADKSILLVGASTVLEQAKEVLFDIAGTLDAEKYFGATSPFVPITKVLIQNGVTFIKGICIDEFGADKKYTSIDEAYEAAFEKSLEEPHIKCIIIDKSGEASINIKLKQHLNIAESNDLFRYGVIGTPVGSDDAAAIALATSMKDKRIFVAGPNVIDGQNNEKDGIYTAAGLASLIMTETNDPALPMNGVGINGYSGVCRSLLKSQRSTLANGGVVALYPDGGTPTVHRLVTTYTEDDIWREGTTVFIADDVLETVETKLRANYKRTKNVARILDSIKTDVIAVLESKNGLEIIQDFDKSTVSVIKDPEDLYGALVDYEFKVVTPLYTITIRQHMKL